MKDFAQGKVPGLLIVLLIASAAHELGRFVPVVGGPVYCASNTSRNVVGC